MPPADHSEPHTYDRIVAALSTPARTLWAKTNMGDPSSREWTPLHQHLADTANVAAALWDDFLPLATRRIVARSVDGDIELARKLAIWLAASHDLGKATPAFAWQVDWLREQVADAGLSFHASVYRSSRELPHSMSSYFILKSWLKETHGLSARNAIPYACVPLGHHGSFTEPDPMHAVGQSHLIGTTEQWKLVQFELAQYTAGLAELTDADFAVLSQSHLDQPAGVALTGLTILADWIASNPRYFPLTNAGRGPHAAAFAMTQLNFPPPWQAQAPESTELFAEHLGLKTPRPLQTKLVELARQLEQPELLILEAPTGEGKTKAALGAAEVLASQFALGGVLFSLPTQATSDGIFDTVRQWLTTVAGNTDVSLSLAHGKAQFNDHFTNLQMRNIYDPEGPKDRGQVVAHSYLTGRRKLATMSDVVVGTVDQLLLGALRAKHVALRHLGVAGKVVVIDEVHASDTFMRRYLCRMLTWLAAYDVPVIAMSATLTPSIRHELLEAYNEGRNRSTPDRDDSIVYPRITRSSPTGFEVTAVPASSRTTSFKIDELPGDTEAIAAAAMQAAANGGNVAVVCGTVRRAQDIYRHLAASGGPIDVRLLHSRFLTPDRMDKESKLRQRLGPDALRAAADRPLIVVATQVIEQSLDIDFDLMFSDIAPIDLLIQRAGRLHRHEWKHADRPPAHRDARLILTGFERLEDGPPLLDRGCRTVYGASPLLHAIATIDEHLDDHDAITSPTDVATLVTRSYESITSPDKWDEAWEAADRIAIETQESKRRTADSLRIPPPTEKSLSNWSELPTSPDISDERSIAQVRDSEDSIEVVVVQRINGRRIIPQWAHEHAGHEVDYGTVIDDDIAVTASKNTLRLPSFLGTRDLGDQLINELEDNCVDTWQSSQWLRGALPLILDEDGNAQHAGFDFHYDTDLGLVVTKQEES